jgi:predicted dehydrogenase
VEESKDKKGLSRREFMKAAGVTAAGVVASGMIGGRAFAEGAAPAPASVIGANSQLRIGMIGIGGMGSGHLKMIKDMESEQNVKIVAVCDLWKKRRERAAANAEVPASQTYEDYRKLLENKDIDVVVIATADHWHGQCAIDALEAGKHVYVEKPMTRYLDEALKLHDTVKRTGKQLQVGSQGCTDTKWHKCGELVREGKIGTVLWAQGGYCRDTPTGEWNYYAIDKDFTPESIDWKFWLGKAPKREFSPERYFRWRKYWDYGTGIIGDLWPHRLHPLMIAMDIKDFPKRVTCVGANIMDSDKGTAERRDVADTTFMTAEFPGGQLLCLAGCTVNEQGLQDMIRGNKATLNIGGDKIHITPERPYTEEIDAEDVTWQGPGESQSDHHKNLWNCIRNGGTPNCNIDLATRVQTIVSMAEMSYRQSKMACFDPAKRKVIL